MVSKLLEEYDVKGIKPSPGNPTFQDVDGKLMPLSKEEFSSFRTIVITLLYVARRTRPDILFQVVWFTSGINAAMDQNMLKLRHLVMYLNGSEQMGMRFVPKVGASSMAALLDLSH